MGNEEWKLVADTRGLYEVSSHGRVRRLGRSRGTRGGVIRATPGPRGYARVNLYTGGGSVRTVGVHRLMGEAFLANPNNLPVVRHLNDDPTDNRLENLSWGTHADNTNDMMRNGHHRGAQQNECKHGHEFTPANTYMYRGRRNCRKCVNSRGYAYRDRKRGLVK